MNFDYHLAHKKSTRKRKNLNNSLRKESEPRNTTNIISLHDSFPISNSATSHRSTATPDANNFSANIKIPNRVYSDLKASNRNYE
jgi:hypothetical protein